MRIWFSMASPSMKPLPLATYYQMGVRSPYPVTPHAKRRWRIERAAALPAVVVGDGEGRHPPTSASSIPCSASAKVRIVVSEIPRDDSPGTGGVTMGHPPLPWAPHPLSPWLVVGGRDDSPLTTTPPRGGGGGGWGLGGYGVGAGDGCGPMGGNPSTPPVHAPPPIGHGEGALPPPGAGPRVVGVYGGLTSTANILPGVPPYGEWREGPADQIGVREGGGGGYLSPTCAGIPVQWGNKSCHPPGAWGGCPLHNLLCLDSPLPPLCPEACLWGFRILTPPLG